MRKKIIIVSIKIDAKLKSKYLGGKRTFNNKIGINNYAVGSLVFAASVVELTNSTPIFE